ncbi:MAG: S26 family signal peptidase [Colwellia sp.]|nr:S26 family signal peptidase [Colwellia sp.]
MTKLPIKCFVTLLLNLLIPGAGLVVLGYWRLALLTQLILITPLLLLCFSRLIFSPEYIIALVIVSLTTYLLSSVLCLYLKPQREMKKLTKFLATSIYSFTVVIGLFLGFSYKDSWLGVHLYFVPSMSMYPTLKPGQFILVDTWIYNKKSTSLSDIVVFKQTETIEKQQVTWLVKRIANWPQGQLQKNGLFYLLGDNNSASHDSRSFGGIKQENIVGKVKLVLFDIDNKQHPKEDTWLQPVH